jgi:YebC/PmpR family DNA-binding regulatory protein
MSHTIQVKGIFMAGHSKWNNIKKRKGAVDAKRGKIFGVIARQIRSAVKEGKSGDPQSNPNLRTILEKARSENMPKEKIQKAIAVGLGKGDGGPVRELVYEGFGPGGVGMLAVAFTDNTNRTTSEIKTIFSKNGGSIGAPGSAMYLFSRSNDGGYTTAIPFQIKEESQQKALQGLMDDLRMNDDIEDVFCSGEWEDKE